MIVTPDLEFITRQASATAVTEGLKPRTWTWDCAREFLRVVRYAIRIAIREPEVFSFAAIQWVTIAVTYCVWIAPLSLVPDHVWETRNWAAKWSVGIAVTLWSMACVGVASYPVGHLTGCIGAVHYLRLQGKRSTIGGCLSFVHRRRKPLWHFAAADGWVTVMQLMQRFGKASAAERLATELAYFAWKIGSLGVVPAILAGHGLVDAGKSSLKLLQGDPGAVVLLRGAYGLGSGLAWLAAVGLWVPLMVLIGSIRPLPSTGIGIGHLMLGAWVVSAVGIIHVLLRPVFILASCRLYSDRMRSVHKAPAISQGAHRIGGR